MTAPPDRIFVSLHQHGIIMVHLSASPEEGHSEYIRADLLSDPVTVHLNMLRGTIAKPSLAQIAHIYGDEWTAAIADAEARGLRMAADRLKMHREQARANLEAVGLDAAGPERTTFNWMRWAENEVRALIPAPKEKPDE